MQVLVCKSVCVQKLLRLKCLCVKASVCKGVYVLKVFLRKSGRVRKGLCVKTSVCKSVCV